MKPVRKSILGGNTHMKRIKSEHKKEICPSCGSKQIYTHGFDQLCLDCNWDNTFLLVQLGQMDNPKIAAFEHFVQPKTFESLQKRKSKITA